MHCLKCRNHYVDLAYVDGCIIVACSMCGWRGIFINKALLYSPVTSGNCNNPYDRRPPPVRKKSWHCSVCNKKMRLYYYRKYCPQCFKKLRKEKMKVNFSNYRKRLGYMT